MHNLTKYTMHRELTREEKEMRLFGETAESRIGRSIDEGERQRKQMHGNIKRGIIALLATAGVIFGLNEASKRMGPLPTSEEVAEWAKNNLHGQMFNKK